ncbi:DNA-3-methyladenine glycosylase [Candidatus Peregrinibacteria bacterium]|nr:MAG: DNA-3-methyladenine glycosylase [Candidatus Peregrinibacteria bacterium]
MNKALPLRWFNRPTVDVARDLLGKYLVRRFPDGTEHAYRITETEAYDGPEDLACHASKGRTPRTEVMFGEAGHFYVYFVYGIHWLLNIVTGPTDFPSAVLIRGLEGLSGPARLTKALQIDKSFYGKPATPKSDLWFEDRGEKVDQILATPRIGVDYAGKEWARKEWRFVIKI